ncbi:alpha/beta hydrolase [Sphingomonas tabacisoli]|uniref:Alpha/beta hydrolase n=1 Tax=Sphingomonas tabacisoli TaxID=2249466 RepID=A0ABW4I5G0_9SPHN
MSLDLPVEDLARIEPFTCNGPAGLIALRLFDARPEREAGPVVVFFHGGGFALGSVDTHAALAASLARGLDLPVVSVEYRLAPEHPFPAAVEDAEAATRWIAANGFALGLKPDGLVLAGDSAGGNLAIVTALALRQRPAALRAVLQLAIYPMTDESERRPSRDVFAEGFGLDATNMALFHQHYGADSRDPRHSPLLADLDGLPPAVVVTAALDPLRDEGRAYAAKLVTSGVDTLHIEAPGLIHGFASYRRAIPSAETEFERALHLTCAMLRAAT